MGRGRPARRDVRGPRRPHPPCPAAQLARGEATVNELAAPHDLTLAAVSRHLKVLETAGLVAKTRQAQWRSCRLVAGPLQEVDAWMEGYRRFFADRFDRLGHHLPSTPPTDHRRRRHSRDRLPLASPSPPPRPSARTPAPPAPSSSSASTPSRPSGRRGLDGPRPARVVLGTACGAVRSTRRPAGRRVLVGPPAGGPGGRTYRTGGLYTLVDPPHRLEFHWGAPEGGPTSTRPRRGRCRRCGCGSQPCPRGRG